MKDIITRIGKPEQLTGDEAGQSNGDHGNWEDKARTAAQGIYDNVRARTAGKKLYRNPKDKMLAGVLSGLAVYTKTDPVVWRLLTVLLTMCYGIGLVAYIVLAIVLPEAKTPEQLLQMEGKEVTPQNLADVVVEKDEQAAPTPNLLRSLFSVLLKILFGFSVGVAMIVCIALCCGFLFALVVLVSALVFPISSNMPFSLETMGLAELYQTNPLVLVLFAVALFLMLLIPIYAIIHMVLSLAGKVQPMGIVQRIVWIVLWVAALCTIVPCGITMANYSEDHDRKVYEQVHFISYQGVDMEEDDADFLRHGSWNLLKAENCAHYTYRGEYYNGDSGVRYLDAYDDDCDEVYQAERKEKVEPGVYRLSCLARSEGPGPCIYAIGDQKHLKDIPVYGNRGGELVDSLRSVLPEEFQNKHRGAIAYFDSSSEWIINGMKIDFRDRQANAKFFKDGVGWSVVSIDKIVVKGDSIAYGVSSDEAFTGKTCHAKWFSAADFTLTRTGDLPAVKK